MSVARARGGARAEGDLRIAHTADTRAARREFGDDPFLSESRFGGVLVCSEPSCGEATSVAGMVAYEPEYSEDEPGTFSMVPIFTLRHADPAPDLFRLPDACAAEVAAAVHRAFALFWSDPDGAVNACRSAVELLLDDVGIPRTTINVRRKRVRVPLDNRLEQAKRLRRVGDVAEHLLATKWIGNAGAHGDAVDRAAALDAFELLEHALTEIYERRAARTRALAKAVNRAKGPRRPPRGRRPRGGD